MANKNKKFGKTPGFESKTVDVDNPVVEGAITQEYKQLDSAEVDTPKYQQPETDENVVIKDADKNKSVLKPTKIGSINYTAAGLGDVASGDTSMLRGLSFSGTDAKISGSVSEVAVGRQSRANTRSGRKTDRLTDFTDQIISEQIVVNNEAPLPLRESASQVQGYRGQITSNNVKVQKILSTTPADVDFNISIDDLNKDNLYFVNGQQLESEAEELGKDFPTVTQNVVDGRHVEEQQYDSRKGNYLPRSIKIVIDKFGRVKSFQPNVLNLDVDPLTDETLNSSSQHSATQRRMAELERRAIEANAGDESQPNWSPLGRVIAQPTQTIHYMKMLESEVGAVMNLANMKANMAMSYNINRTAKDGNVISRPLNEYLLGTIATNTNYEEFMPGGVYSEPFSQDMMKNGSAGLMIAIHDSLEKYKSSKTRVNVLQQGFRGVVSNMANNISIFRTNNEHLNLVNNMETFSTPDGDYDPLKPVYITDHSGLVLTQNWADQYSYTLDSDGNKVFTKDPFAYAFYETRSVYRTQINNPILKGLDNYFGRHATRLRSVLLPRDSDADLTITIPVVYSTKSMSLWQLLLCDASSEIAAERLKTFKDFLEYERTHGSAFKDLVNVPSEINPRSFNFTDNQSPLVVGRLTKPALLSFIASETWHRVTESGSKDHYIAPWYFSEAGYEPTIAGALRREPDTRYAFNWPVFGPGVRHEAFERMLSFDPREARLAMDILTGLPSKQDGVAPTGAFIYKFSLKEDGIPVIEMTDDEFTQLSLLKAPREIGLYILAPRHLFRSNKKYDSSFSVYVPSDLDVPARGGSSFSMTSYHNKLKDTSSDSTSRINLPNVVDQGQGSNYNQVWTRIWANIDEFNQGDLGVAMSFSSLFDHRRNPIEGQSIFTPFVNPYVDINGEQTRVTDNNFKMLSAHKWLAFALEYLPFFTNPFESVANSKVTAFDDGVKTLPFEMGYYFSLKGFAATDYYDDHSNRMMRARNLGMNYTSDLYVEDSLLTM